MNELDRKITTEFAGYVVRKDLVKIIKGNAIVPTYVLEYLLGQYCATSDEDSIASGIETVKEIIRKHYVHRQEAGLVRSKIKESGHHKVIDVIAVSLNDTAGVYEASFSNLGIKKVLIDSQTVKKHSRLLVGGVWCISDLRYEYTENQKESPWILESIKPIQLSNFDFENYLQKRSKFNLEEWIDLLIHSIGFDPEKMSRRRKLLQLTRLIPYCERNYNLIELGPKGTGKSHIYADFSPHGILISGGEVSVPKLFVNNSSGKLGLVGYWDTVAFDEFAGKAKKADRALVDIMKNYMANKTFSRGVDTIGAEASMVFVGNTQHNVAYMLKHSDLFDDLPVQYHDSAFLDRIHYYLPGWEFDIIRGEQFSTKYGFVVDYLAEGLRHLRGYDFSHDFSDDFTLNEAISTRDRDGVLKTFSGLMKILFPGHTATKTEKEELLQFCIEGRKRVKDQLLRIDPTFSEVSFGYEDNERGFKKTVKTLEEQQFPQLYKELNRSTLSGVTNPEIVEKTGEVISDPTIYPEPISQKIERNKTILIKKKKESVLEPQHITIGENQQGISYEKLFGPYIKGATKIIIEDPYLRNFYQIRNVMEFVEMVIRSKAVDDEVFIHVVTGVDDFKPEQQEDFFNQITSSALNAGIQFIWEINSDSLKHDRYIILDNGWKIILGRGLDIFQHYEGNDAFSLNNRLQEFRGCKECSITIVKE